MWTVVAVMATACISGIVAPDNCACHPDLMEKLRSIKDCYKNATPPKIIAKYDVYDDLYCITNDVLPSYVKCVGGKQIKGKGLVDLTLNNGSKTQVVYEQSPIGSKIIETDPYGVKWQILPIVSKKPVYWYVRCAITPGFKGTGNLMMSFYGEHGYENDSRVKQELKRFKSCASQLGVKNLVDYKPCE